MGMFRMRVGTDEFMKLALSPENLARRFERMDGEIIELVSNDGASEIASIILGFLASFVYPRRLGRIKGADGGYNNGDRLAGRGILSGFSLEINTIWPH